MKFQKPVLSRASKASHPSLFLFDTKNLNWFLWTPVWFPGDSMNWHHRIAKKQIRQKEHVTTRLASTEDLLIQGNSAAVFWLIGLSSLSHGIKPDGCGIGVTSDDLLDTAIPYNSGSENTSLWPFSGWGNMGKRGVQCPAQGHFGTWRSWGSTLWPSGWGADAKKVTKMTETLLSNANGV